MANHLVIVESPAKAKTLKKYIGQDYTILASYGHVRDLIPKEGAVEPDNDFAMHYQLVEKNTKHVQALLTALKKVDSVYLASDPDREGEAIAWHISEIIKEHKTLRTKPIKRIVFYEVTKNAVQNAFKEPRDLCHALIDAQHARRALDYLVGFNLSPLLWKKIRRGLSAGRVQSPALRMIVERQEAIDAFVSQEYWSLEVDLVKENKPFVARLTHALGEKLTQFSITSKEQAEAVEAQWQAAAAGVMTVSTVKRSQRKRQPAAPFITSTLQQEAARKLGFSTQRTMRVAQQLYEGIEIAEGPTGLITYMRTDSVNLAQEAVTEIRSYIVDKYGQDFLPKESRVFKTKAKNAQEAHEAIRPTSLHLTPEKLKQYLSAEQLKLYLLIWNRTIACQMAVALFDVVTVDLTAGQYVARANGSVLKFSGFLKVYEEGVDDQDAMRDKGDKLLPDLVEQEEINVLKIRTEQHFTEPPPRFTEASLVKSLEEFGIGRPSTYASIISTLKNREYVTLESKRFEPTDVGKIVSKFLTKYFPTYVDYDFTAKLEDSLDNVALGKDNWLPLMKNFWTPFHQLIQNIDETVQRKDVTQESIDEACPECQHPLSIRLGKRGRFIGCTNFPECKYTRSIGDEADSKTQMDEVVQDRPCPKCQSDLVIKQGPYGKFIGCSTYPKCKFIESLEKPKDTEVTCPSCQKGTLLKRKSRYGTFFYACSAYPTCKYAIKSEPLIEQCPQCQWPILMLKVTKRRGTEKVCPQKECDFAVKVEEV